MDGSGLGANDWTEMELKKRAYRVIASDSALLQEASAVESGDSTPVAGCSGPVPMVWAPRAARGGLARAVYTRRAHQCERSRSRLVAPIIARTNARANTRKRGDTFSFKIPVWWRRAVLPSLPWVVRFLSFLLGTGLARTGTNTGTPLEKKEKRHPKGGVGGRHAATTQGF